MFRCLGGLSPCHTPQILPVQGSWAGKCLWPPDPLAVIGDDLDVGQLVGLPHLETKLGELLVLGIPGGAVDGGPVFFFSVASLHLSSICLDSSSERVQVQFALLLLSGSIRTYLLFFTLH